MDIIAKLRALEARVHSLERENTELRGRVGNLPVRPPLSMPPVTLVAMSIAADAAGPRKSYKAKRSSLVVSGTDVLSDSQAASDPQEKLYNLLEETSGTTFLVTGDDVKAWKQDGVWVCCEPPRGFA